jgi:hypothetical protein
MFIKDVQKLYHGCYRIFWKSGGYSIAAVGSLPDGTRWMAPTNWVGFTLDKDQMISSWEEVSHVEFIVGKEDVQES